MSSSLDHKCQRCGSQYHGQICPFCTITGLDVNALLAAEGLTMAESSEDGAAAPKASHQAESTIKLIDVVSNRTYPVLAPVCRFGRDISNDIVLTGDKSLSRFHFQVTVVNGDYLVEDAGSRNGTFLNGSPVAAPRKILNGDIISAGMSRYRFVTDDSALPPLAADNAAAGNGSSTDQPDNKLGVADTHGNAVLPKPSTPDPLEKLFAEGQALMGNTAPDLGSLDELFSSPGAAPPPSNTSDMALDNAFMQLERPKETPVDELFQEQLKAMASAAAEKEKQDEHEAEAKATAEAEARAAAEAEANAAAEAEANAAAEAEANAAAEAEARAAAQAEANAAAQAEANAAAEAEARAAAETQACVTAETAQRATTYESKPTVSAVELCSSYRFLTGVAKEREFPAWSTNYSMAELSSVGDAVTAIEEEIRAKQVELEKLLAVQKDAEYIKNSLIASQGEELYETCSAVFGMLGWNCKANGETANELVVSDGDKPIAIIKIVVTDSQPKPAELANLVGSLSTFWCDHGVEPKGIMLVSWNVDGSPTERPELSADLASYASKKHVCLMTTMQLLGIYRAAAFQNAELHQIQSTILGASGMLPNYELASSK